VLSLREQSPANPAGLSLLRAAIPLAREAWAGTIQNDSGLLKDNTPAR
jgi:hypothetical protein